MITQQLLLDLDTIEPPKPTFEHFIPGDNEALLADLLSLNIDNDAPRLTYLFGLKGAGKTHLLKAAIDRFKPSLYLDIADDPGLDALPMEEEEHYRFLSLDNVDALSDVGQQRVFHLCNQVRAEHISLFLSGGRRPVDLPLREDLKLRLAHGTVWMVIPLSDEQKLNALYQHVQARSMVMQEEVLRYLLHHTERNLSSLMRLIDIIDHVSLAQQQKPTLPMVKMVLNHLEDTKAVP